MHLYLSERSPLNAAFTNESGQVIYKVSTPRGITGRISTINRILPSDIPGGGDPLRDRFGQLATVEHHAFRTSIIKYGGKEIKTKEYFRKVGFGFYGRHRAFTGPDGKEYKWILGSSTSRLCLNDKAETPVAKFHKKSLGIIGAAHPASLEIFPPGERIIDNIVVTFIYIEKLRKDKENNMKNAGHG